MSAEVNDGGAYRHVDLQSGFVPAQITGTVTGPQHPGRSLAFAVNGRIVATAPSFRLKGSGKEQFSVVVSDRDFYEGRNTVQILWVRRGGPAPAAESLAKIG